MGGTSMAFILSLSLPAPTFLLWSPRCLTWKMIAMKAGREIKREKGKRTNSIRAGQKALFFSSLSFPCVCVLALKKVIFHFSQDIRPGGCCSPNRPNIVREAQRWIKKYFTQFSLAKYLRYYYVRWSRNNHISSTAFHSVAEAIESIHFLATCAYK